MSRKKLHIAVFALGLVAAFGITFANPLPHKIEFMTAVVHPEKNEKLIAKTTSKKPPKPPTKEAAGKSKTKSKTSKTADKLKEKAIEIAVPKLVQFAGQKVPEPLVNLYKNDTLKNTVSDFTNNMNKMAVEGNISGTATEGVLRDIFSTAMTDTASFANGLLDKYNLTNVAMNLLRDPKNGKEMQKAIQQEIQNYAEQELNKLANQAIGTLFPVLQGVQFDFTNMNSKTLKSTLRSTVVNALAQAYLGPEYVAVYMAVSTVCPPCMQKVHAELRRFDKKYLQPAADKVADEWDRFEDRLKEESARIGKQIAAEWNRLKERVGAELNRQKEDVEAAVKSAKEKFNAELERAKNSKVGEEISREVDDAKAAAESAINTAKAELEREYKDIAAEAKRVSKRVGAEIQREINDQLNAAKKLGNSAKEELKREAKQYVDQGKKIKEKIQEELSRAAEKAKEAVQKAGCQGQKVIDKLRGKKKKKKC